MLKYEPPVIHGDRGQLYQLNTPTNSISCITQLARQVGVAGSGSDSIFEDIDDKTLYS